ncbi:MAG: DUF1501 domain-containing protein [Polyangiaceae bacterium]
MQRRSFLQAAAAAGLALTAPSIVSRASAGEPFAGPFWILCHAAGGWDPTLMFDPVISAEHTRSYTQLGKLGNIPYAPTTTDLTELEWDNTENLNWILSNEAFLTKYGSKLTVFNGVDTKTNNHDSGTRSIWSGKTQEGYPSFGALLAANKSPGAPMAFLSSGGYDATEGLIGLTRVSSVDALTRIARPNQVDVNDPESSLYHTPETWGRIAQFQADRAARLRGSAKLLRKQQAISALELARAGDGELSKLQLPDALVDIPSGDLNDLERFMQQGQIAIHAFKSGLGVSASLGLGGYDTHANNDRDQRRQQAKLLGGIDYLVSYAAQQGLGDKIMILVGSDFGRSPYNERDGKDHHPISSFFCMGSGIPGDRLIGATTAERLPMAIDPGSLATVSSGGTVVTPAHIQRALRRLAGVAESDISAQFPLEGTDLPLFG